MIRRKYGGTGLWLTISREMAAKLGGKIELESEPAKGSVFTLYLPLQRPEAESAPQPAPVSIPVPPPVEQHPAQELSTDAVTSFKPAPPADDDRDKIQKGDKLLLVIEDDANFAK